MARILRLIRILSFSKRPTGFLSPPRISIEDPFMSHYVNAILMDAILVFVVPILFSPLLSFVTDLDEIPSLIIIGLSVFIIRMRYHYFS